MDIDQIDVVEGNRATIAQGARCSVFTDSTDRISAENRDRWQIVTAGDCDRHGALYRAALVIQHVEGEGFNFRLTLCQVLHRSSSHVVIPGHHAAEACTGGVGGHRCDETSQGTSTGGDSADAVDVGAVDIGEGEGAGTGQDRLINRRCFRAVGCWVEGLGDGASDIGSGDDRCIIGAGHIHRVGLGDQVTIPVGDGECEDVAAEV